MRSALFCLLSMTLCVLGCSTGTPPAMPPATPIPSQPAAPTPVYPDITGNWSFSAATLIEAGGTLPPATPHLHFTGYLQSSGPIVTGILRATDQGFSPCVAETTDLPVTGTLDSAGNLTMSLPLSGGMATFSLQVPQSRAQILSNSSLTVTGGSCARAQSPVSATKFADASGTYTGTLQSFAVPLRTVVQTATITAVLVQSPTPNADGQFPLSGTVTAAGDCSATFTFTDGIATGGYLQTSGRLGTLTSPSIMMFTASLNPLGSNLIAGIANFPGCNSFLNGILVRQ